MPVLDETPEVSIVIPCLNEANTLSICIQKAQEAIRIHHLAAEIIVADSGSHDDSPEIAKALGVRVIHAPKGYGAALMAGITAAQGTCIVMGDADASYDFGAILPFLEKLREGFDLVMGCRFQSKGGKIMPGAMPWTHRWLGNPVLSGIGRLWFQSPITDFHCGMRAFRRAAIVGLDLNTTGMEFASEMVIKATLKGLRISEVPITLHKDQRNRPSHLRTWRDGWRHLRFMLLYSPNWLFLVPGWGMLLVGSVIGGLLLKGPIEIGGIGFDTNTLLACAMIVLMGFKLIAFAMFAKIFAISEGLLPENPHLNKLFSLVTLERGLLVGAILILTGCALLSSGILYWHLHSFGPISYPKSLRLVIPGVTALTLGVEIVFSSFFLSILGLRRK
jgi:glycosyltransferase involved in cell wall biosynthesis